MALSQRTMARTRCELHSNVDVKLNEQSPFNDNTKSYTKLISPKAHRADSSHESHWILYSSRGGITRIRVYIFSKIFDFWKISYPGVFGVADHEFDVIFEKFSIPGPAKVKHGEKFRKKISKKSQKNLFLDTFFTNILCTFLCIPQCKSVTVMTSRIRRTCGSLMPSSKPHRPNAVGGGQNLYMVGYVRFRRWRR